MNNYNVIEKLVNELKNIKMGDNNLYSLLEIRLKEATEEKKHVVFYHRDRQVLSLIITVGKKAEFYVCSDRNIESTFFISKTNSLGEKESTMRNMLSNLIPEIVRVVFANQNGLELKPINWSNC